MPNAFLTPEVLQTMATGDAFRRRILRWKCPSIGPLSFAQRALPGYKTLTFWSGDGGTGGVTFPLWRCHFGSSCLVVCDSRHRCGEEGGGLAKDSSF
jgi:hypothetical protein